MRTSLLLSVLAAGLLTAPLSANAETQNYNGTAKRITECNRLYKDNEAALNRCKNAFSKPKRTFTGVRAVKGCDDKKGREKNDCLKALVRSTKGQKTPRELKVAECEKMTGPERRTCVEEAVKMNLPK